jgi:hypothetical protein
MNIIKKYWVQFLWPFAAIVVCVYWVTSTILAERAITLARVRQVDFEIIAELLAANNLPDFEGIGIERVSEAFNQLKGGADLRGLWVGLLLERNGEILASNIGDRSVAGVTEELSLGPEAVETRVLGNDTILTAIFPDRNYSFYVGNGGFGPTPWHWEISVPYRQLMDGRLDWGVIFPKAGSALKILLSVGLFFLFLWLWSKYLTDKKLRELEEARKDRQIKEKHCQNNVKRLKEEIQQTTELLATEKEQSKGKTNAMEDEILEWMAKAEVLGKENEMLQQEIDKLDQRGVFFGGKRVAERLLDNIWSDLEWHNQAKKEAFNLYAKKGQPSEKRQLTRLLGQIFKDSRMPEDWTAFENTVWHNPGKQQTKLYCSKIDGTIIVIGVSSGKDHHERFDDGETLLKRYETMRDIFRRAA